MTFREIQRQGIEITEKEYLKMLRVVNKNYKEALDKIRKEIKKLYVEVLSGVDPERYYAVASKFNRLVKLQKQIADEYIKASNKSARAITEASNIAIANNFYRQQFSIKFGSSVLEDVNMPFTLLNKEVIDISVFGTDNVWKSISESTIDRLSKKFGDLTRYQPKHGTLIDTLLNNRQRDLVKLKNALTQGLINGESFTKTSTKVKNILGTTASNAERIVRTEGHRNMMSAQMASNQFAKSEGVEAVRMIDSTLDGRTRPQSASVDGQKENEDGFFVYPGGVLVSSPGNSGIARFDINDREVVITAVEGVPPKLRRARNPVTGKTEIISYKSFNEWADEHGLKYNKFGRLVPRSK